MTKKEVEIFDYGYFGEGVGKLDGKATFVPYALKDELVEIEVEKETSSFCKGKLVKVLKASPKRKNPPCPYFAKCGGCAFQNLDKEDEKEIKLGLLSTQLGKLGFAGKIEFEESQNEYGYRNKIKLFCDENGLGLFQQSSKKLVNIEKCLLVKDRMNKAIESLQTFIKAKNLENLIDEITIRQQGENLLVWIKFKRKTKVDFSGLQIMLGAGSGIFASVGKEKPVHKTGISSLKTKEFSLDCEFEVDAFHQVNDEVGQKLYQTLLEEIEGDKVINAYSGAGVLSGIIAKEGKTVYGIELGLAEHESAQRLKEKNNLNKLFNIKGDCGQLIPDLISSDLKTVVLDPPRAGIDARVADAINKAKSKKVIYISCDPSTLVRDLGRMDTYKIKKITLFDMFAKTSRVEVLCILEKKQNIAK